MLLYYIFDKAFWPQKIILISCYRICNCYLYFHIMWCNRCKQLDWSNKVGSHHGKVQNIYFFIRSIHINCWKSANPISSAIRIQSTWALKYKTTIITKYWSSFYAFMTFMSRMISYNHLKSIVLRYILHSIRIGL